MAETNAPASPAATPRRRAPACLATAALGLVALWGLVVALEDGFIYFPTRYPDGPWEVETLPRAEGEVGTRIEDQRLETEDGVTLHGWWAVPVRREGGQEVAVPAPQAILWFHGNAGNLSYRADMLHRLVTRLPARVLIVDYRGYGRSEPAAPSEEGLYRDARAAWDHLTGPLGVAPSDVVLLGKSLGGAPAAELATRVRPGGLILQSTFTSVPDMAKRVMPFVPGFLLRTRMDSLSKVGRAPCPVLVVHSPVDEVIPYAMGRSLFAAAPEPKRFLEVPGAGHNDTYLVGGETYLDGLRDFLALCRDEG